MRGGFSFDPGQIFDRVANGKTEIKVAEITDFRAKGMLDRVVQAMNITNGVVTRDQFVQGWPKAMEAMRAQWANRGMGGPTPTAGPPAAGAPSTGSPAPAAAAADGSQWDAQAEADFKRMDLNGDGFLNENEMNGRFLMEWRQWDANQDGKIDMNEYKAYFRNRMQARMARMGGGGGFIPPTAAPVEEEEKKAPVYRAGKLPQGIPSWFEQLDTDKDGQIGLYEWLRAGRSVEDFMAIDRNQDGFLTIQEIMRVEKNKPKAKQGPRGFGATPPVPGTTPPSATPPSGASAYSPTNTAATPPTARANDSKKDRRVGPDGGNRPPPRDRSRGPRIRTPRPVGEDGGQ
jgi:hypothetical protein